MWLCMYDSVTFGLYISIRSSKIIYFQAIFSIILKMLFKIYHTITTIQRSYRLKEAVANSFSTLFLNLRRVWRPASRLVGKYRTQVLKRLQLLAGKHQGTSNTGATARGVKLFSPVLATAPEPTGSQSAISNQCCKESTWRILQSFDIHLFSISAIQYIAL